MIAEFRLHELITPDSQGDMDRKAREIHEQSGDKTDGSWVIPFYCVQNVLSSHSRLLGVAPIRIWSGVDRALIRSIRSKIQIERDA